MKRTLITLLALVGCSVVAQGMMTAPLTITFGDNSRKTEKNPTGKVVEQPTVTLNSKTVTYNQLYRAGEDTEQISFEATSLKLTDTITSSPIGITLNNPVSGAAGQINTMAASANGENSVVGQYFTADMLGGAVNYGGGQASITLTGLTRGNYVLYVLGARGNVLNNGEDSTSGTDSTTYSLSGANDTTISGVQASILDYAVASGVAAPTLNVTSTEVTAATYGANNVASNWVLMSFSFDVLNDNGAVTLTGNGGSGNIAALTLVPEPSSAALSLLALAGLAARRRRKD